jgi:hypothetical protein
MPSSLTILGGITALISLYLFLVNHKSSEKLFEAFFIFSVVSSLFCDAGYFFTVGSFEVLLNYVFAAIMAILSVFIIIKYRPSNLAWISLGFLFAVLFCGVAITKLLHYSYYSVTYDRIWDSFFWLKEPLEVVSVSIGQFLKMFIRLFLFFVEVTAASCMPSKTFFRKCSEWIAWSFLGVFVFAFIEFFIDNFYSSTWFRGLIAFLIGNSSGTSSSTRSLFGYSMPLLLYREPSSMAFSMLAVALAGFYLFRFGEKKWQAYLCIIGSGFFLVLSGSLSSFIYLFILVVFFYFVTKRRKLYLGLLLGVGIPAAAVGIFLFRSRLITIVQYIPAFSRSLPSDLPGKSEVIRLYSIYNNFCIFLYRPLYGVGLGSLYCYSGLVSTLSNIGLLGLFCWCFALTSAMQPFHFRKKTMVLAFVYYFAIFALTGHMGDMVYTEKSFFILVMLCALISQDDLSVDKSQVLDDKNNNVSLAA